MRVVVTGMGVLSAAGTTVPEFSAALRAGRPGDRPAPWLIAPSHQTRMGAVLPEGVEPEDRGPWDKAQRMAIAAVGQAATQAGLGEGAFPVPTALLLGTSLGNALAAQRWHRERLAGRPGRRGDLLQAPVHAITDGVARRFRIGGPRTTISNACVSGTNAIGTALDMLRAGEVELAIAGGVDTLHSFNFAGFATLWALTQERCRPFDSERTGMLLGESAAFLVMEPEDRARARGARPLAEVAGYGSSGDAVHITAPDREGGGAYRAMNAALADAGATPADVDFVSLHGTGTLYADGMEAAAMGRVFGARVREVPAASLRPVTGHTMGSAGSIDSVACVLAITEGFVPPTANHRSLDPNLPAPLRILTECLRGPVRLALNTSSGFAGSNATVVFKALGGRP